MGIRTVAVYADGDASAAYVREAVRRIRRAISPRLAISRLSMRRIGFTS
jgi:acetyl/propionyl-CoA carboxylase alpha subunit